ncbi:YeeE/YedE family protein [Croceivirga thetidis]|uniref:YeeE/YedE family protein n=1 Tax=Croceivirga thetidis TaxID=2721623 RepID=A0ABX1GLW4_9FLAO|nr:YeeE/YedE thiosulfate transporter family protein [Croceivirga thetidis]NKI30893.1 YeeE/YedE family protein [Croceivirga thetidis]
MDVILQPWPWYVSGPLIALTMALLILTGRRFGMSSNLRTLCSAAGAGRIAEFFRFDWRAQRWNLIVALGVLLGGFIAQNFLSPNDAVAISEQTIAKLKVLGFNDGGINYMPEKLFGLTVFSDVKTMVILIVGGFLVGFGARYAGGCTSGHAISGLSNLQLPSLIAVIGFFAGGLLMVHLLFPLIF